VANDPIKQFEISTIVPIEIAGIDFSFTNSSLFMLATTGAVAAFLVLSTTGRGLVPGRWQAAAEMSYEFVASMLRDAAGTQGMRFFPLVFSLFMFVLFANLFGMFPYFLHRHQPHHRHLRAGDAGDRHGHCLRLHEARLWLPQALRARGHSRRLGAAGGDD
jgi:F0F1-type ATP synthase membrane subunit a